MFNTIIKTFMNFVLIFALFLLGFAISFFMLVQNQSPFDTFGRSFAKSLIMMIGEFEYEGIFDLWDERVDLNSTCICGPSCANPEDGPEPCIPWASVNFYHYTMYVMFVLFVITMTIIVSNMLVGLAVDDIKAVQDTAVLQRQALKIKLALEAIYQAPNKWRYSWFFDKNRGQVLLDSTKNRWMTRFQNWIDPESQITREGVRISPEDPADRTHPIYNLTNLGQELILELRFEHSSAKTEVSLTKFGNRLMKLMIKCLECEAR